MQPALIAQVAVTTGAAALLSRFAAGYLAQQTGDLQAGLALRVVLVTAALLAATWLAVRPRLLQGTRAQLRVGAALGLGLGYALNPSTWTGRTYAAELVTAPGVTAVLLDLALWLLVGGAAVAVASAPAGARERATYAPR